MYGFNLAEYFPHTTASISPVLEGVNLSDSILDD